MLSLKKLKNKIKNLFNKKYRTLEQCNRQIQKKILVAKLNRAFEQGLTPKEAGIKTKRLSKNVK